MVIEATWEKSVEQDAAELLAENSRLKAWVNDLQAGMYINCVYCGHRYGPNTEVAASMADVLKEHIEQCPEHPLSAAKVSIRKLEAALAAIQDRIAPTGDPEVDANRDERRILLKVQRIASLALEEK